MLTENDFTEGNNMDDHPRRAKHTNDLRILIPYRGFAYYHFEMTRKLRRNGNTFRIGAVVSMNRIANLRLSNDIAPLITVITYYATCK